MDLGESAFNMISNELRNLVQDSLLYDQNVAPE